MKREIKFRAWHIELEDMVFSSEDYAMFWHNQYHYGDMYELMQFTGLLDKNGKEIYESDLCKDANGFIGSIEWHNARAAFVFHDSENYNELLFYKSSLEVIGNRFETPDLLK